MSKRHRRRRTYNLRLIKPTWPYTVQEIAALFGIHKNAVTRWLRSGLQANRDKRPILIRGDELVRFLGERQRRRRHKCKPTEFFCLKCREPRSVYLGIVDVDVQSAIRLRLKAVCEACGRTVNKVQAASKLPEIRKWFEVQQLTGAHLLERPLPSLNGDLETLT